MPQEELTILVERLVHFMNIFTIYRDLLSGQYVPSVGSADLSDQYFPNVPHTMEVLLYAYFYSLVEDDSTAINAFRIWRRHFPEEENAIANVESKVKPFIADLKLFRNRLGFHGSRSFPHESAGFAVFDKHSGEEIFAAMIDFKHLGAKLLSNC